MKKLNLKQQYEAYKRRMILQGTEYLMVSFKRYKELVGAKKAKKEVENANK
jgi:hypothetical protein